MYLNIPLTASKLLLHKEQKLQHSKFSSVVTPTASNHETDVNMK